MSFFRREAYPEMNTRANWISAVKRETSMHLDEIWYTTVVPKYEEIIGLISFSSPESKISLAIANYIQEVESFLKTHVQYAPEYIIKRAAIIDRELYRWIAEYAQLTRDSLATDLKEFEALKAAMEKDEPMLGIEVPSVLPH